ncbi:MULTISPECIES: 5-carboxymethyl-2-hydroxymuconate semialdehyde dehydrogenase [unclassified Streptomyces]|uniref:5-carboxymethyl-2-hydroxymuconate semialdehyde dehydrogenase n=1 Tax=unclassified Streptomyces TaxID=2593676 RepID=UPI000DAC040B|nr:MULTISPECIES: 5-carboxymethyl-2-hydroxymuconate semialdehyde dehydrogenase [unclassified Streptomyces]PZT77579.1 5-carboxymethyl-2-hydroxymuconate semialdehyde dehydrogenase [Streptomyces sp. AC1-42W]PZT78467.1 5-carboxymethyl-2-hydroxymuconate semialdehyde dehydrogenase [Streptomyces sp. AC1-42T]
MSTNPTGHRPQDLPEQIRHWIGGELLDSADGRTFPVSDPVSNTPYATAAAGDRADVDRAVAAARAAFPAWSRLGNRERARVLYRIADAVEAREERLAALETFDSGLPITQARGQARRAAENFRYFGDVVVALGEEAFRAGEQQINYVVRSPVGVAGLITPWNTPFMLESWKLAPALASGCTLVLKPAEWTPLSASLWPEIFDEAGVPAGVVNIVHGIGEEAGQALVDHPDVPLISFTGSTDTGRHIVRSSATHLKTTSMELGGKSPVVLFADADLDAALDSVVFGVFSLNGERCTAGSRVLVERPVYEEFTRRLAERAERVKVGLPSDPATEVGALVHPEHYARVLQYVEIGRQEAKLVAGGERPAHLAEGNYLQPTVFADVARDARIFQEEIFGPVVAVAPFDDEAEAVELANATEYGLAAYVWTADLKRGHRVAHAVESGMVWINSHNVRDLRTPFGGVKSSGLGREGGAHSIDFYTESKIVHVMLGDPHTPRFGAS